MLGLLCVCFHSSRVQAADDLWWAKDKQKHLLVSSGAAFATYIWLGHSGLESTSRAGVAALVVLGVGALKEARDALGYGHASWKDMTWNVIGTAVGLVVAWAVERWLWPRSVSPPRGGWRESNTAP
jgi:putative lipoprotein